MISEVKSLVDFQNEIAYSGLTVVDFYATWCGPCKMIEPVVEKLSQKHVDSHFLRVDVDETSDVAAEYGISAMPTFLLFKDGQLVNKVVGANPQGLNQAIAQNL